MRCPFCDHQKDRVVDSREGKEGNVIRRRRECLGCKHRFTTYERMEDIPYVVVKKEGRRERFDRSKLAKGLLRACEKRPALTVVVAFEYIDFRLPEIRWQDLAPHLAERVGSLGQRTSLETTRPR